MFWNSVDIVVLLFLGLPLGLQSATMEKSSVKLELFTNNDMNTNMMPSAVAEDIPRELQQATAEITLELRACCGRKCDSFTNPVELFGLKCCGEQPTNLFDKICCENKAFTRRKGTKYYEQCCAGEPLAWDQTCCEGIVHNTAEQACCGNRTYNMYDTTTLCCGRTVHFNVKQGSACCGEDVYDGGDTTFCCGAKAYPRRTHDRCCVFETAVDATAVEAPTAEGYSSTTQICCDKIYDKTTFDTCCYHQQVDGKWISRPFNSQNSCCDAFTGVRNKPQSKNCADLTNNDI